MAPGVYLDRDGVPWVECADGLVALDEPVRRRLAEKFGTCPADVAEAGYGPLRRLA